jgi:hypothetical protein
MNLQTREIWKLLIPKNKQHHQSSANHRSTWSVRPRCSRVGYLGSSFFAAYQIQANSWRGGIITLSLLQRLQKSFQGVRDGQWGRGGDALSRERTGARPWRRDNGTVPGAARTVPTDEFTAFFDCSKSGSRSIVLLLNACWHFFDVPDWRPPTPRSVRSSI